MNSVLGKQNNPGRVLMHEHLTIDLSGEKGKDACLNDNVALIDDLKSLKNMGIDTIVDVTNIGMGRDVKKMVMLSEESRINVVASTGFYKTPYLPEIVYTKDIEQLAKIMIKEIVEGIENTGIKAGIIGEIGTGVDGFTQEERKVFLASIRTHKETGVPITTHTTLGKFGLEQTSLFKENGTEMEKVIIGHMDLNPDMDYYNRILESGCYIGFDTIGKNSYQPDDLRAHNLYRLVKEGYGERIVLSLDITKKSHLKKYGGYGHSYIVETFIPMLLNLGLTQDDIDIMLIENPKRIFGGN